MRPNFTLRQLDYFVAVAETGSIRAASERLNMSSAALSQALTELELELGSTLLTRRRAHGIALTATGRDLLVGARNILEAAADLFALTQGFERGVAGRVRIGCYTSLSPFLIPRLIRGFKARFPALHLETVEGSAAEIQDRLRDGSTDIALLYGAAIDEDIASELLYSVRPHVLLAAAHPLAASAEIDLRLLASEPFILFDVAPASHNISLIARDAGIEPVVDRRVTNFELLRSLVAQGLGYSIVLHRPQASFSYEGLPLTARPLQGSTRMVDVVVARLRLSRPARRTELMIAACHELIDGSQSSEIRGNS